jgi:hypothetical protein
MGVDWIPFYRIPLKRLIPTIYPYKPKNGYLEGLTGWDEVCGWGEACG